MKLPQTSSLLNNLFKYEMTYNSNKQTFACSNFGSSVPKNKTDKIRVFLGTPFDDTQGEICVMDSQQRFNATVGMMRWLSSRTSGSYCLR